MNLTRMTPVQAAVIPLFQQNKDVVVEAVTGSGKTLAFAIPIIEKLVRREHKLLKHEIGAIIMLPTRELAIQVFKVIGQLLEFQSTATKLAPALLLIGGKKTLKEDNAAYLQDGASILVGTPGRLEEFLLGSSSLSTAKEKGKQVSKAVLANVKNLEMVVLDEADRLLDLGFQPSLTRMLLSLPKQRRTGLFSATMTDAMGELIRIGLRNPVRIVVKVESKSKTDVRVPSALYNYFVVCKPQNKLLTLLSLLEKESQDQFCNKFIVYFSTCAAVDYFYKVFSQLARLQNYSIHSLHGQQPPSRREATFDAFTTCDTSKPAVLLCTDVAARGLDLPDVDCVVQFDPPQDPKAFSHRCGRTARAGRAGKAFVLLLEGREEEYVDFFNLRKIPLSSRSFPVEEDPQTLTDEIRAIVKSDRDLHEKGTRAFVSFVRSYSKHEASFIFRLKDLDLPALALTYGLLRLPKMPEAKSMDGSKWIDADVDWDAYAFLDPTKEAQRQSEDAKAKIHSKKRSRPKQTEAWTDKKERKAKKALQHQTRIERSIIEQAEIDNIASRAMEEAELKADEQEFKKQKRNHAVQHKVEGVYGDLS